MNGNDTQFGPLFHGTSVANADNMLREGPKTGARPRNQILSHGPGLYTWSDHATGGAGHLLASTYAEDHGHDGAVVEGHVANPRIYHTTPSEDSALNNARWAGNSQYGADFNARKRAEGYNVIAGRVGTDTAHVVINDHAFVPRRVHFNDGKAVDL